MGGKAFIEGSLTFPKSICINVNTFCGDLSDFLGTHGFQFMHNTGTQSDRIGQPGAYIQLFASDFIVCDSINKDVGVIRNMILKKIYDFDPVFEGLGPEGVGMYDLSAVIDRTIQGFRIGLKKIA